MPKDIPVVLGRRSKREHYNGMGVVRRRRRSEKSGAKCKATIHLPDSVTRNKYKHSLIQEI